MKPPCQFTWPFDADEPKGHVCGREAFKQQLDGEWRCLHHVNVGYHTHWHKNELWTAGGYWIYEKPVDCGHPLHCAKCCCGKPL